MEFDPELANRIWEAADDDNLAVASSTVRSGLFIVFQQIDPEGEAAEELDPDDEDAEQAFSVVLAEMEDDVAVVCFTGQEFAQDFATEIAGDIPEGHELPAIQIDGDSLLDGLPNDCGLLVNPGSDHECYFPPGAFA